MADQACHYSIMTLGTKSESALQASVPGILSNCKSLGTITNKIILIHLVYIDCHSARPWHHHHNIIPIQYCSNPKLMKNAAVPETLSKSLGTIAINIVPIQIKSL